MSTLLEHVLEIERDQNGICRKVVALSADRYTAVELPVTEIEFHQQANTPGTVTLTFMAPRVKFIEP